MISPLWTNQSGLLFGMCKSNKTVFAHKSMGTLLLLLVSAILCFAVFYKLIEWFEHI